MSTIVTPPASTLSQDSDTEILTSTTATMPPASRRPLYLIVATALNPAMGIGLGGSLPWPALKKDMAFFRRVTSGDGGGGGCSSEGRNAVIMGRKTWESIPSKFRPLRGRINLVLTRNANGFPEADGKEVLAATGLQEGLEMLQDKGEERVGKIFVIGGSQIYQEAIESSVKGNESLGWGPLRILQTQVRRSDGEAITCDTFFPLRLEENVDEPDGWRRAKMTEVQDWVNGESVPGMEGWEKDGDMEIRVIGWERDG